MTETPILGLKADPPGAQKNKIGIDISLVVGGLIGFGATNLNLGFSLILWFPAMYIVIGIHELGHLIAGQLVGMAPGGLVIGGFGSNRDPRSPLGSGLARPLAAEGAIESAAFDRPSPPYHPSRHAKGVRPRDWDRELFPDDRDGLPGIGQLLASDRLRPLERAIAVSGRVGSLVRHGLYLEAAAASGFDPAKRGARGICANGPFKNGNRSPWMPLTQPFRFARAL